MSTNIRVNVGNPQRLIDLNRRQQKANREAFVTRDEARRASDKAFDQLERERKAAGLNPATGRPITSARIASGFPRIDQEPAANRFGTPEVIIFYSGEINGKTHLISGDGLSSVEFELPELPPVPDFPALVNTEYPDFVGLLGYEQTRDDIRYTTFSEYYLDSPVDLIKARESQLFQKKREIPLRGDTTLHKFPLGNGLTLVVRFRYREYASVITRYFIKQRFIEDRATLFDPDPLLSETILTDELMEESYTAELESDWVVLGEDWIGAVVGEFIATAVDVPDKLKDAIRNEAFPGTFYVFEKPGYVCIFANSSGEEDDWAGIDDFTVPPFICLGQAGTYGYTYWNDFFDKGDVVKLVSPTSPLGVGRVIRTKLSFGSFYGLADNSENELSLYSTTPFSWFLLDSDGWGTDSDTYREYVDATTHSDVLNIDLKDGRKVSQFLKSKFYIDVSDRPVSWRGGPIDGPKDEYAPITDTQWSGKVKSNFNIPPGLPPGFSTHYMTDWGAKSFCRQQAARYDIEL